ncbi:autophagy-related protein 13a isoform X1 [Elaeis guineensis]|uniref:Autophagy-related protein 13a isoform X1 n=1 Tax=Elaeis guineensis var. tenera TaxID=51953 RepID=A0A6I9RY07_ELAGV|nr:autophagy-related protein 13a isoform X1 [Elaeis guineensis]
MAESSRTEQIITQFYLKALHAILGSRIPHLHGDPSSSSAAVRVRKRDRWFNLALGDLPPALDHPHHSVMDPMIIDVILTPRAAPAAAEVVVERWTAQCESAPISWNHTPDSSSSFLFRRTYKKSILLLRSLYSFLRLLPAYRVFRMLSSSNQSYNYDLSYRVSSFAEPFSRVEERELKLHSFTPVETQFGQLVVSVQYRPTLSDFNIEVSSLLPSMIITDYVGSPAAEPMRAFPSSPYEGGARPMSFSLRGHRTSANPSAHRPHSWTSAPLAHHPMSSSPIPASDATFSPPDVYGNRISSQRPATHRKGSFSFDEFKLSPPFSPSPTPSPPAHGSSYLQSRLRSETAPVSIPQPPTGKSQVHRSPNLSDPTRSFLPPPSPRSMRTDLSSQNSPLESRSFRKSEGLRIGDTYSNMQLFTAQKSLKDGRDDSGRFSSVLSSGGSPRLGFSRSSSRLSIQDDLDDGDFSYPFAVDDVDTSDSQTSRNLDRKEAPESVQASSHKSQDAAVGILVHMLKTAPPLRQDESYLSQSSRSELNREIGTSSLFMSRKTSDALEELQSYKEIKDILLSRSGTQLLESVQHRKE